MFLLTLLTVLVMDKAFHGGKNQLSFWSIKMKIFCLKVKKKKKRLLKREPESWPVIEHLPSIHIQCLQSFGHHFIRTPHSAAFPTVVGT